MNEEKNIKQIKISRKTILKVHKFILKLRKEKKYGQRKLREKVKNKFNVTSSPP
jgi:hypothetical protein